MQDVINPKANKLCAITFDDGPNLTTTVGVLDALERLSIQATFFLVGKNITPETAPVMKRALAQGCELQNHSWSHSHMTLLSPDAVRSEILKTSDAIESVTGVPPAFFRPPYFETNDGMAALAGMPMIGGVDCEDWVPSVSAGRRARLLLDRVEDGSIILLHDFGGNEASIDALELVVPELARRGYAFVTVSELFKMKGVDPARAETLWQRVVR
jgi:peptidoglycan/xylan/chitin deacetylase (PgdA/CDA1 family)